VPSERTHALQPLALLTGGLTAAIIARSTVIPSEWHFAFNLAIAGFSLGVARLAGMSAEELGCARRHAGAGLRLGGLAFLAVTLAVASTAPLGLLDDDRTTIGVGEMLLRVLVVIPIGTVLVEELAFRGTLYALLERATTPTRSMIVGSVLFGLWHAPPILDDGAVVVVGTVLATTVAGAAFIWLRRRSGSLLAPILAHIGTNSATFALSWAASR
jgi:membrane protease YdiL (CAAX protease family)